MKIVFLLLLYCCIPYTQEPLIETSFWRCKTSPNTYDPSVNLWSKKHLGEFSKPMLCNQNDRFEKLNDVQLNVFRFEKKLGTLESLKIHNVYITVIRGWHSWFWIPFGNILPTPLKISEVGRETKYAEIDSKFVIHLNVYKITKSFVTKMKPPQYFYPMIRKRFTNSKLQEPLALYFP